MADQIADKWACKSSQAMLLESENISAAVGDAVSACYGASRDHFSKSEKGMTLQSTQHGESSSRSVRLTSLVHIQLGYV